AALWNGQAPQTTTGAARVSESHCQFVNCSAGTIAIAITGTVSTAEMTSRSRSARTGSAASVPASGSSAGSDASYPAWRTVSTSASGVTVGGKVTFAFSVA